jgi:hypothetical protein
MKPENARRLCPETSTKKMLFKNSISDYESGPDSVSKKSPTLLKKRFILQREIMAGLVNACQNENLLWNIERTVTNVFIPLLNANGMGDKAGESPSKIPLFNFKGTLSQDFSPQLFFVKQFPLPKFRIYPSSASMYIVQ